MSSKSGFISNLNKSTKITMASCIGFGFLTGIILVIFILFPITPSEKVMASIGRENISNNGSDGSPQSVTPAVVTTSADGDENIVTTTTRAGTTTVRTVNIRITTGSGFLWNGRIPTGVMPGSSSTTVVEDPEEPTPDPGVTDTDIPQGTTPPENEGGGTATTPNPDPNGGTVTPPADEPVTPPDTPVTPPADNPDPPSAETPVSPPADSGGTAENT